MRTRPQGAFTTRFLHPYWTVTSPKSPPTSPKTPTITHTRLHPSRARGGTHGLSLNLALFCIMHDSAFDIQPSVPWSDESPFGSQPSVPRSDQSPPAFHSMSHPPACLVYLGLMSHQPVCLACHSHLELLEKSHKFKPFRPHAIADLLPILKFIFITHIINRKAHCVLGFVSDVYK